MLSTELYQAITLIIIVSLVDLLELIRPGFPVSRRRELGINILALTVVIIWGELAKEAILSGFHAAGLDRVLPAGAVRELPAGVKILLTVILGDLSLYWVHRAMHHNPVLWKTHAFHHSIPEIWWLAGARTSMTHLLLFAAPQIFIGYYLLGLTPLEAGIGFSIGVIVNVWIHINSWVDLGPLEWLIITPNFHRIHHGARGYTDKNLGFVFTVWDRMFGTYADPRVTGKDFPVLSVPTRNRLFRMVVGY